MESTIDFLKRRLKSAGSERWTEIATAAGVAKTLPRKLAYGDRANPGIRTVQPLLDYFGAIDRGEKQLPAVRKKDKPRERRDLTRPSKYAGTDIDRRARSGEAG